MGRSGQRLAFRVPRGQDLDLQGPGSQGVGPEGARDQGVDLQVSRGKMVGQGPRWSRGKPKGYQGVKGYAICIECLKGPRGRPRGSQGVKE